MAGTRIPYECLSLIHISLVSSSFFCWYLWSLMMCRNMSTTWLHWCGKKYCLLLITVGFMPTATTVILFTLKHSVSTWETIVTGFTKLNNKSIRSYVTIVTQPNWWEGIKAAGRQLKAATLSDMQSAVCPPPQKLRNHVSNDSLTSPHTHTHTHTFTLY